MAKVFTITEGLENMGALKTGGQGSVYKGRRIGKIITAVKLLPTPIHSESADDKHFTDFQNEVTKLKKVNEQPNPNVVKILSSGITESGSFPFIEMEFIEGPDLEELLKPPHDPVFTIKEAIKVADQLSHALAHCHKVDVKHGDIKSNNVKYNIHTGNYVLLDFGLAIMSDEQRRTSLRHAGAIEFMAPEQNEGQMLFQTDVYSFGVVMYELLAGVVPFPLREKGETARNRVMVAHMETPPPDILILRRQHLPAAWSEEKKAREMQVPEWLLDVIYKCLEKKPVARFEKGVMLHEHIVLNSTLAARKKETNADQLQHLQQDNARLQQEKEQLQQLMLQYQERTAAKEKELSSVRASLADTEWELNGLRERVVTGGMQKKKGGSASRALLWVALIVIGFVGFFIFSFIKNSSITDPPRQVPAESQTEKFLKPIGDYKVSAARAYFHNEPDESTRRNAYMVPSNDVVTALKEENGFIYTEFTNNKGQTSKGWLRKQDVITLEEWKQQQQNPLPAPAQPLTKIEINAQLQEARRLMEAHDTEAALNIYSHLSEQEVPEAMYEYGNLALKNQNPSINCEEGMALVKKASDKGHTPAKTTLGFLYLFAENREVLAMNDYEGCQYEKNFLKGSRLLMEAMLKGDSTAGRLLKELNLPRNEQGADTSN